MPRSGLGGVKDIVVDCADADTANTRRHGDDQESTQTVKISEFHESTPTKTQIVRF
jgi:hypothetical protein